MVGLQPAIAARPPGPRRPQSLVRFAPPPRPSSPRDEASPRAGPPWRRRPDLGSMGSERNLKRLEPATPIDARDRCAGARPPRSRSENSPEMREAPAHPGPPSRIWVLLPSSGSHPADGRLFSKPPRPPAGHVSSPSGVFTPREKPRQQEIHKIWDISRSLHTNS